MDNVTHALAGCLIAAAGIAAVERRAHERGEATPLGLRRAMMIVGIVAAELPDSDLVYAGSVLGIGKLGYLLHHRGHTHTIVFAIAAAFLLWGMALWLARGMRAPEPRRALLGVALVGTLSHILLDFTNSYGVHPFWPVDNRWFYGDAVFIVEPWLWVVSIPPLLLLVQSRVARVVLALLLLVILAAAWAIGMVERTTALVLTLGAIAWLAVHGTVWRAIAPPRRVVAALVAWLAVETVFFTASSAARAQVRDASAAGAAGAFRDVSLNPTVANPFCHRGLLVALVGAEYRVTDVVVAPFPSLRDVASCSAAGGPVPDDVATDGAAPTGDASVAVRRGTVRRAPHAELVALATGNRGAAVHSRARLAPRARRHADVLGRALRRGASRLREHRHHGAPTELSAVRAGMDPAAQGPHHGLDDARRAASWRSVCAS